MAGKNRVSAQVARMIAFVAMIGAGLSAFLSYAGRTSLGLKVCAGSAGLGVLILLVGAYWVAASKPGADRPEA